MKKILLLGGSAQQVVAIETAKRLGYYTILCDYLSDNPGQYYSDKFYLASTTDKEKILQIAKDEKIDGILAYASDPAAPTAAYVAEKLGLPGNPYESVEILCNKDKFREFLKANGFNTPKSNGYVKLDKALFDCNNSFKFPIIIKPVDSSGSKGVSVVYKNENISEYFDFAMSFSRTKKVIIEEYVEKKHKFLIGGDIFVLNGKIVQWGLLNCHRDNNANPLVPVGKSYPVVVDQKTLEEVKRTLQNLVDKLNIRFGSMNVELIVNKFNEVFLIDIGPRSGGNMIPDLLSIIFGKDIVEMCIKTAMGVDIDFQENVNNVFFASHNIHSLKNGTLESISFSEELSKYIYKKFIYKKKDDIIEFFDNSTKLLGIIFLKFEDQFTMDKILSNINEHILINLKK